MITQDNFETNVQIGKPYKVVEDPNSNLPTRYKKISFYDVTTKEVLENLIKNEIFIPRTKIYDINIDKQKILKLHEIYNVVFLSKSELDPFITINHNYHYYNKRIRLEKDLYTLKIKKIILFKAFVTSTNKKHGSILCYFYIEKTNNKLDKIDPFFLKSFNIEELKEKEVEEKIKKLLERAKNNEIDFVVTSSSLDQGVMLI